LDLEIATSSAQLKPNQSQETKMQNKRWICLQYTFFLEN